MKNCKIRFCGRKASAKEMCDLHYKRYQRDGDRGKELERPLGTWKGYGPTKHPSMLWIMWAAGFIEGEGNFSRSSSTISASQKEPEVLFWLKDMFGGSVIQQKEELWRWSISGAYARGVMMTIYSSMSSRRQEEIRRSLNA